MREPLLKGGTPIALIRELAQVFGVNEALFLQQLHFLASMENGGKMIAGVKWVWNTLDGWHRQLPFFSVPTIRRVISELEKKTLIFSCQPDGRMSRKKHYRVNYHQVYKAIEDFKFNFPDLLKMSTSKTETTFSGPSIREPIMDQGGWTVRDSSNPSRPVWIPDYSDCFPNESDSDPLSHKASCYCVDCRIIKN